MIIQRVECNDKININVQLVEEKADVQLECNGIVVCETEAAGPELCSQQYRWLH